MMKRDLIVFEHEKFELTGYDVWMTAGEIAGLFGVTIMKIRGIVSRMNKHLAVDMALLSKYELLENGYKDELFNLECIIAISYRLLTGLAVEFRHWTCDRTTSLQSYRFSANLHMIFCKSIIKYAQSDSFCKKMSNFVAEMTNHKRLWHTA